MDVPVVRIFGLRSKFRLLRFCLWRRFGERHTGDINIHDLESNDNKHVRERSGVYYVAVSIIKQNDHRACIIHFLYKLNTLQNDKIR